jgi:hypothetical protein
MGSALLQGLLGRRPIPTDPFTEAQAQAQQASQPYLNELARQQAADESSARGVAAQNTKDLNASYAAQTPMIDKSYGRAIGSNAAIEDAVAQHLNATGTGATTDLRKQLELIGSPSAADEVAKLADVYKGAGGAEYATGTSDIQNLVSNQAAAHELLGKQQISDTAQIGRDLSTALTSIAKDYGVQKADVLKALPDQVAQLVGLSQSAASDKEKVREYNKEYNYRTSSDLQSRMDARHKLALETKLTMQQTMDAHDYKVWAKKFDANQKALDRQSRQQIAAANRNATASSKASNQNYTGPASQKYITVTDADGNPTVIPNPNYVPPSQTAKGRGSDTVDTAGSSKRNRAYDAALQSVFNKTTGQVRQNVIYAQDPNIKAMKLINAALKGMGVDPYSPAGNQIRQSLWTFLDGKRGGTPGKMGTFTDPRKDDPRFQRKPKKKK